MKKIFFSILLIAGLSSCIAQQPNFNFKADHISLLVKDLEKSANFYEEILGLEQIYNAGLGENFKWYQLTDKFQVHLIKTDKDIITDKEIHLAINTTKLDELMDYFRAKKVPFENWQGEANTTNTRPDKIRQIYIQDIDGYWIEINDNKL